MAVLILIQFLIGLSLVRPPSPTPYTELLDSMIRHVLASTQATPKHIPEAQAEKLKS
jgi:hypothetical protein